MQGSSVATSTSGRPAERVGQRKVKPPLRRNRSHARGFLEEGSERLLCESVLKTFERCLTVTARDSAFPYS